MEILRMTLLIQVVNLKQQSIPGAHQQIPDFIKDILDKSISLAAKYAFNNWFGL